MPSAQNRSPDILVTEVVVTRMFGSVLSARGRLKVCTHRREVASGGKKSKRSRIGRDVKKKKKEDARWRVL